MLFHHQGGVDVGDVDAKANKVQVDIDGELSEEQARCLVGEVPAEKQGVLVRFLQLLYRTYSDLYFTLLEINPLGQDMFCKVYIEYSRFRIDRFCQHFLTCFAPNFYLFLL